MKTDGPTDTREMLIGMTTTIQRTFQYRRRDEEGGTMTLRASHGWPAESAGLTVPLATSIQPGYTLLRGQGAIVVEDFRREGRFSDVKPEEAGPAQSSISIRIPGTSGGFGSLIAASDDHGTPTSELGAHRHLVRPSAGAAPGR